jgi:hypothetical protein
MAYTKKVFRKELSAKSKKKRKSSVSDPKIKKIKRKEQDMSSAVITSKLNKK